MSDISNPVPNIGRTSGPSSSGRTLVERHYLSLNEPALFRPGRAPTRPAILRALDFKAIAEWRALYRRVGAPWRWYDRDAWSDEQLANYLAQPGVAVFAVDSPPILDGGILELCTHADGTVEIVYLGLIAELFGHLLGAWLLGEAVRLAWDRGAGRVWLHTCSLDGPHALPNYLARGFGIDRTEMYSIDDTP